MATNPTKILLYDLDPELGKLMDDLKRIQDQFPSLYERLTNIGIDLFDEDTKRVVTDLVDGYNLSSKLAVKRIEELEDKFKMGLTDGSDGSEAFDYDPVYQNVTKHTVKNKLGAILYTVDYNYSDPENGTLQDSQKKYTDANGNGVLIKKTYSYDNNGNITGITTATTVTPPAPVT